MITLQEKAYAKVNLTLDVGDLRADGYHDISTIMQAITLADEITIHIGTGEPWQVRCSEEAIPGGKKNLAYKAAKAYYDAAGTDPDGLTIEIEKRIPWEAGLGGGSADAAAVLRALNRHENNRFTDEELEKIGLHYYVLVKPDFSAPTSELYQKLDRMNVPARPKTQQMIKTLEKGNLREIGAGLLNVFEFPLLREHEELYKIENALENCGALGTSMTGSGSVMFGIFEHFDFAATASMSLMQVGYKTYLATNFDPNSDEDV